MTPEWEPFDADADRFRLCLEARRLGLAYEYDPRADLNNSILFGDEKDESVQGRPRLVPLLGSIAALWIAAAIWTIIAVILVGLLIAAPGTLMVYRAAGMTPRTIRQERLIVAFVGLALAAIIIGAFVLVLRNGLPPGDASR